MAALAYGALAIGYYCYTIAPTALEYY